MEEEADGGSPSLPSADEAAYQEYASNNKIILEKSLVINVFFWAQRFGLQTWIEASPSKHGISSNVSILKLILLNILNLEYQKPARV